MVDYSKIDFAQLKLEPIGDDIVLVKNDIEPMLTIGGLCVAQRTQNGWVLKDGVSSVRFDRFLTDELWKRTDEVDKFIRLQSRRQLTVAEMMVELIISGREMAILNNGILFKYRFNGKRGAIECLSPLCEWELCTGAGERGRIVTVKE